MRALYLALRVACAHSRQASCQLIRDMAYISTTSLHPRVSRPV